MKWCLTMTEEELSRLLAGMKEVWLDPILQRPLANHASNLAQAPLNKLPL